MRERHDICRITGAFRQVRPPPRPRHEPAFRATPINQQRPPKSAGDGRAADVVWRHKRQSCSIAFEDITGRAIARCRGSRLFSHDGLRRVIAATQILCLPLTTVAREGERRLLTFRADAQGGHLWCAGCRPISARCSFRHACSLPDGAAAVNHRRKKEI